MEILISFTGQNKDPVGLFVFLYSWLYTPIVWLLKLENNVETSKYFMGKTCQDFVTSHHLRCVAKAGFFGLICGIALDYQR